MTEKRMRLVWLVCGIAIAADTAIIAWIVVTGGLR